MPKDDEGNETQDNKNEPTLGQLAAGVKLLTEHMANVDKDSKAFQAAISEKLESLITKPAVKGNGKDKDEDDGDGQVDLETLSRKDFAAILEGRITKAMQSKIDAFGKAIDEKVGKVASGVDDVTAREAIKDMVERHSDFLEWKKEISAIIKESPGITLARAYTLARSEDEKKAKELDVKYTEKAKADAGGVVRKKGYGGLTPISKGTGGGKTKMTQPEAMEAAFQQVAAEYGDVLEGLSTP